MSINSIFRISFIAFIFFVSKSFACSCGGPEIERMDKGAEIVFIGNLKSKTWFSSKYKLNASKFFKGSSLDEIEVLSEKSSISCGVKFERHVPYVIFAYREDGELKVDSCSSWAITEKHQRYTDAFNKFYNLNDKNKISVSN